MARPRLTVADAPTANEIAARLRMGSALSGPIPTLSLRVKRVGTSSLLQQAWRHPDGTEWRCVETVPDAAPDWEPKE